MRNGASSRPLQPGSHCQPALRLRAYQCAALDAIRAHLAAGRRRLLVAMPTGTGKTVCFAQLPSALQLAGRWLVLAHREELLDQAERKLRAANPHLTVAVEQAERRAGAADIVVASVQTLQRARLAALDPDDFAGVVCDEAHHATAPTYRAIFDHFQLLEPECARPLIGFTATPNRGDGVGLAEVFEAIAFEMGLREAIEAGWLAPLAGLRVQTRASLAGVHTRAGDFVAAELAEVVDTDARNSLVVGTYLEQAADRLALAFCVGVAHAQRLAEVFRVAGVPAAAVDGETPRDVRRDLLRRFAASDLRVLCNCGVLTEGFDCPSVDAIVMARPTKSSLLYAQCIGRGTRPAPGKADCLVLDFVDASARHSLISINSLFGLPASLDLQGRSAVEVKRELEAIEQQRPWLDLARLASVDELPAVLSRVDLLASVVPAELAHVSRNVWLASGEGYRLPLPNRERVEVAPTRLGEWTARRIGETVTTLATTATREAAIRAADAYLRRESLGVLVDSRARWRGEPASPKQIALLTKLRQPIPPDVTKGEAALLIDGYFARRRGAA